MNDETAIKVVSVSKEFKLPHERQTSLKGTLINLTRHGSRSRSYERQRVLKDVSFEVQKGEFFGIVGKNGSGKSTLLKLLAGIYSPTAGKIQVMGRLTPFIELGVGFNMELTGRENVFLNGALLGFNRKEMEVMYDEIVQFAELGKFMDQKLKNYSSGMQVRLAFSIAIRAQSDILLMDEVLAVGDAAFQQKCFDIFADMKAKGVTIVLVTHDMSAVLRFCDRAILIDKGNIVSVGKPKAIADQYLELNFDSTSNPKEHVVTKGKATVNQVEVLKNGRPVKSIETGSSVTMELAFDNPKGLPIHFGLQIFNESGTYCFGTNTKNQQLEPTTLKSGAMQMDAVLDLVPGTYSLTVATMNEHATGTIDYRPNSQTFRIMKSTQTEGVANIHHTWRSVDV